MQHQKHIKLHIYTYIQFTISAIDINLVATGLFLPKINFQLHRKNWNSEEDFIASIPRSFRTALRKRVVLKYIYESVFTTFIILPIHTYKVGYIFVDYYLFKKIYKLFFHKKATYANIQQHIIQANPSPRMFIVQQMVHRFRPPNLISRATPMKNLIKSTPQTVKRGIFHNRSARDLMRVPGKPIFSFAKSWRKFQISLLIVLLKL